MNAYIQPQEWEKLGTLNEDNDDDDECLWSLVPKCTCLYQHICADKTDMF